eukprot:gene3694-biopygen572
MIPSRLGPLRMIPSRLGPLRMIPSRLGPLRMIPSERGTRVAPRRRSRAAALPPSRAPAVRPVPEEVGAGGVRHHPQRVPRGAVQREDPAHRHLRPRGAVPGAAALPAQRSRGRRLGNCESDEANRVERSKGNDRAHGSKAPANAVPAGAERGDLRHPPGRVLRVQLLAAVGLESEEVELPHGALREARVAHVAPGVLGVAADGPELLARLRELRDLLRVVRLAGRRAAFPRDPTAAAAAAAGSRRPAGPLRLGGDHVRVLQRVRSVPMCFGVLLRAAEREECLRAGLRTWDNFRPLQVAEPTGA